jgi:hypothetical protein
MFLVHKKAVAMYKKEKFKMIKVHHFQKVYQTFLSKQVEISKEYKILENQKPIVSLLIGISEHLKTKDRCVSLNDLFSNETIGTILSRVVEIQKIPFDRKDLKLVYCGKKLDEFKTIEEYNIHDGSNLILTSVGLLGG